MALGLLRGDGHYYHRSRSGATLWAACQREMLQERITPGEGQRKRLREEESVAPFLARGLKPCPKCFQD
jgi:hypothetical protein